MWLLATFTLWQIWDQAPPEWYLIYVICAFLGVALVYVLWKKWGGYHDSEDDKD
jgi:hypothetical protein